jgi:putative ABC transport system ATP-binding protein
VLAGLLRPASGRVAFGGTDVTALEGRDLLHHRRKSVGTVFQTFNLIRSLSALENVMAPLILTGTRKGSARSAAMRLLEELSLADHAGKRPGELSGGQQQRVAFARALVHDPPLLLADEPTAHLDPGQVARILDLVGRMRTPDRLVVIATHDRRFEDVADGVVWMEQATGRPAGERR